MLQNSKKCERKPYDIKSYNVYLRDSVLFILTLLVILWHTIINQALG